MSDRFRENPQPEYVGFVGQERRDWEDPAEPFVKKPLPQSMSWTDPEEPTSIRTIKLRMKPWEVRTAVPDVALATVSADKIQGGLKYKDGSEVQVSFWGGQVSRIYVHRANFPERNFAETFSSLERRFGTSYLLLQAHEWKDDLVDFTVLFLSVEKPGAISSWLVDRQLNREEEEAECLKTPPRYKQSPAIKSFL